MSRHDPIVRLRHMLDHAREAVALAAGKTREEALSDRVLTLALTRLVEIVGEAASQVPPDTRAELPSTPWKKIVGMRHHLVHGYDYVDYDGMPSRKTSLL